MRRLFAIIALTLAIFTVQAQNLSEEFFTSPKSHPRLILKDGDVAALLQTIENSPQMERLNDYIIESA